MISEQIDEYEGSDIEDIEDAMLTLAAEADPGSEATPDARPNTKDARLDLLVSGQLANKAVQTLTAPAPSQPEQIRRLLGTRTDSLYLPKRRATKAVIFSCGNLRQSFNYPYIFLTSQLQTYLDLSEPRMP